MKEFTPDDLKKYYKGKYDKWKFYENTKGEWVGVFKSKAGTIVSRKDVNGVEYPDIQIHEITSTGGVGLNIWFQAFKNSFRRIK